TTFELDLSPELWACGLHPRFHASKLHPCIPNDDIHFLAQSQDEVLGFGMPDSTIVSSIQAHKGKGKDAMFLVQWSTGQETWEPYPVVQQLTPLSDYLEAAG
ncbi:hypothetical protein BS47DRAFT_1257200, partial [Hydnum rufescens UP504]